MQIHGALMERHGASYKPPPLSIARRTDHFLSLGAMAPYERGRG